MPQQYPPGNSGRDARSVWPRSIFPWVLIIVLAAGCAGRQKDLLVQEYKPMRNEELLRYYYELSDEIDRCLDSQDRASVGVGTGLGLGRLGVWLGLSRPVAPCNPDKLFQRRVEVRLELNRRGISP